MTKNKSLSFALSREELYVILVYLKTNKLTGLDNGKVENPSKDNSNGALEVAEKGLLARGFLRPETNGRLKLIDPLFATVGTCAFPETSILITRIIPGGIKQELYFHTYRKMLVVHTIPITDIHQFNVVEDKKMALGEIKSFLNYTKTNLQDLPSGKVELDALLKISEVALEKDGEITFQLLIDIGLDKNIAKAFAQTLSKPLINTNMAYVPRAGELTEGFTILEGRDTLWLIDPVGGEEKQINLSITSPDEIYKRVQKFVDL